MAQTFGEIVGEIGEIARVAAPLKGYSENIAVTTPSIFIEFEMFAFW